ncbi:MAG: hypothetical protein GQ534_11735, partial [Candidatus Delongbacteria bacterium]|nr:hypothetical protein [Candidatus Delongbacteria bacterium]
MSFKQILFLVILLPFACTYAKQGDTWLSDPIQKQLRSESRDDQLGFGRLFIPTMSKPDWEPTIKIYSSESMIHEDKRIGESIFLKPGNYTLVFGSSTDSYDQVQKRFTIHEQQTTIIDPEWSGLLVNVINENLEKIRFGYEILHLRSGISVGTVYSREENDYEEVRTTWLLPPGKYKLVKQGEPFNTIQNFTTFELKE